MDINNIRIEVMSITTTIKAKFFREIERSVFPKKTFSANFLNFKKYLLLF